MPPIDLRRYVVASAGAWTERAENRLAERIRLTTPDDQVTLTGPLRVRVGVRPQLLFQPIGGGEPVLGESTHASEQDIDIPAGFTWTYHPPIVDPVLGHGNWWVDITPAQPRPQPPMQPADCDVPCDYAVGDCADTARFFPAGCEPCPPGCTPSVPPGCTPSLATAPARGGCVHPRYFNGMLIAREDLETEGRYTRLKHKLHNRAAGTGVVWGLNVALDGGKICVGPGYAVDCCGNDLTVTTPYVVDPRSLLCDPAAARTLAQGGAQRLHLLLEYVECVEEPRPVHGEACTTRATQCEMSRVRETVRLRLVPPRDLDTSGPIADFLREVATLRQELGVAAPPTTTAQPVGTPAPRAAAPFGIVLGLVENGMPILLAMATPTVAPFTLSRPLFAWRGDPVSFDLRAENGAQITAGRITTPPATIVAAPPLPATRISWTTDLRAVARAGGRMVYDFDAWTVGASDGTYVGTTVVEVTLTVQDGNFGPNATDDLIRRGTLNVRVTTKMSLREVPPPRAWPCLEEPCGAAGDRLFPVMPPWLHANPARPSTAGDDDVLLVAALYALLAMALVRFRNSPLIATYARAALAGAAERLVGTKLSTAQLEEFRDGLQRLFERWCASLLYPGPRCRGTPHGVVIGCATVQGGMIRGVDPWGGRRWVVHYPLLAHWGAQFGLVPLDVTLSRVAHLLCCISALPAIPVDDRRLAVAEPALGAATHLSASAGTSAGTSAGGAEIPFGAAVLTMAGAPTATIGRRTTASAQTVPLGAFIGRILASAGEDAPPGARYARLAVAELPGVELLVPETTAAAAAQPDRLVQVVRSAQPTTRERMARPFLRPVAEDLTANLLREIRLADLMPESASLRNRLEASGIATAADMLARDPAALEALSMGADDTAALEQAVDRAENAAVSLGRAASATLRRAGEEQRVSSRSGLADPDVQRHVARDLLARVRGAHLPLSQAELDRGVAAAAGTPEAGGATTEGGAETRNDVPRDEPSGDETPYRDESRALDREDRDVEDRDARDGEADDDEDHE